MLCKGKADTLKSWKAESEWRRRAPGAGRAERRTRLRWATARRALNGRRRASECGRITNPYGQSTLFARWCLASSARASLGERL